jgi:phosphatidylglycerol---prolipoprotein diacylglyceryl transferase
MRSTLLQIPVHALIPLGPWGQVPLFGPGLLLGLWVLFGVVLLAWRVIRWGWRGIDVGNVITWGIVAAAIYVAPQMVNPQKPFIPIYGYGAMLFVGFLTGTTLAASRLRRLGVSGDVAWDVAMWIFVGGIVGSRLFFIAQYHDRFFIPGESIQQTMMRLVNLPDGGLVFYGGMILGSVAYIIFCRTRRVRPLALGDVLVTSVFIGYAFGRLGCFLNGCCFGDFCELPWAVTFPADSVPWKSQVFEGFLAGEAPRSLPVHPTQVYSTLGAFLLAGLTWAWYPYRRYDGEVLALGMLAYPINRFLVEFLRGDELGQFGTMLTISQWVSLGLFATGLLLYVGVMLRSGKPRPLAIA